MQSCGVRRSTYLNLIRGWQIVYSLSVNMTQRGKIRNLFDKLWRLVSCDPEEK